MLLVCIAHAARHKDRLMEAGKLAIDEYVALADEFESIRYPKILRPPLAVYGDFHGDKESMLHAVGNGQLKLFLGDYVDRGSEGVFCLQMAIALQLAGEAIALRGNHEEIRINERYGFLADLAKAYPQDYELALSTTKRIYGHLKLFELIHTRQGAILALHGGVPLSERLSQIQEFAPNADSVEQMLWSDPGVKYGVNSRGAGLMYDKQHFEDWAARNGVYAVVRGHQFVFNGTRDDFGNKRHFTVFSASNYTGNANKGAWLLIDLSGELIPQKIRYQQEN